MMLLPCLMRQVVSVFLLLLSPKDTVSVPTDSGFYLAVVPMAQRLGAKPEDLLWVWASETGFDPTLSGESRTISTMMHGIVVPSLLTEAEWQTLPQLSAKDQLPFIERLYKLIHDRYLGRGFQDSFEAYLANAAAGLLRRDGQYNAQTVMYGNPDTPAGTVWAQNWPMDSYPAAQNASKARGVPLSLDFGKQLVSEGVLRGWITLGDLKNFMVRAGVPSLANDAIRRLHDAQAQASVDQSGTTVPAGYTTLPADNAMPDFSKSFGNPNAPIDTRVAPAQPTPRPLFTLGDMLLVGGALYVGLWLAGRK